MSKKDATQPGVSSEDGNQNDTAVIEDQGQVEGQTTTTDEATEQTERQLSPREVAMAAIKVRRETDDEADQLAAQMAATPAVTPEPEPAPGPRVLSEADLQSRVRIKIDGVEQIVTVAEMQRQFQKNGAADRRLAEATRLLNEAQLREQQLQTPPAAVAAKGGSDDSTPTPADGDDGGAKAFLSSLFEGDEDKAAAALQKLLGGRSQQAPTQLSEQELAAKLTPVIKQQLVAESALEQFAVDNPDIVQDPYLADMADGFLEAEVEAGKPYVEALGTAAKKTRDWLASKGVQPTPTPPPTMDRTTKLERKASIDTVPALNKAASTTVEPAQSASDVIAAMRKARGLE